MARTPTSVLNSNRHPLTLSSCCLLLSLHIPPCRTHAVQSPRLVEIPIPALDLEFARSWRLFPVTQPLHFTLLDRPHLDSHNTHLHTALGCSSCPLPITAFANAWHSQLPRSIPDRPGCLKSRNIVLSFCPVPATLHANKFACSSGPCRSKLLPTTHCTDLSLESNHTHI